MARFESSVTVEVSPEKVFEFLARPANIRNVLPPDAGLVLVEAPDVLELGSRLEFELRGFGPVQRIVHEIVEFESPYRFTENQVHGPLKQFVHEHLVEPSDGRLALVIDRIEFEPPGGVAGFLITEDWIRGSLESSFDHRRRELKRLLEENHREGER